MSPRGRAPVLSAIVAPFQAFFRLEAAGGLFMIFCAIVALIWANSPLGGTYEAIFQAPIVRHTVNDGLMTLFFVVVGIEIKRELVQGELSSRRQAALPLIAAAGGMLVPALIYVLLNPTGPARAGWGVPVATDIAFALGCLTLVRRRVPRSVFVFLAALAIFDDLGAIIVIAFFYGGTIEGPALLLALVLTAILVALARAKVNALWLYALIGVVLWWAVLRSGIHATLAGVIVGLSLPTSATGERAIRVLHRVVAFGIVPLFALANAGIAVTVGTGLSSRVTLGCLLGLVVGKPVGVFAATWLATRLGVADRPANATWSQILGAAMMAGIGFTMSLFIGNLALGTERTLVEQAKLGVLAASFASALLAILFLRLTSPRSGVTQDLVE